MTLQDGSVIHGRYAGKKASAPGEIAIRERDGAVRRVPLETIQSIEVRTPTAGDQIGHFIIFGVVVGLGYLVLHRLTVNLP